MSVLGHVRGVRHGGEAHVRRAAAARRRRVAAARRAEHAHALPLVQVLHCKYNEHAVQ